MLDLAAHRRDRTVAFAVVVILLLQGFFTAWTNAAMASGSMPVDAWGNPLCITSTDDGSSPDGDSVKIPNCCTMGCGMSTTMLPQPSLADHAIRHDLTGTEIRFFRTNPPLGTSRDHDPGSPRAPPLTA
jgi:hypothetical protein